MSDDGIFSIALVGCGAFGTLVDSSQRAVTVVTRDLGSVFKVMLCI